MPRTQLPNSIPYVDVKIVITHKQFKPEDIYDNPAIEIRRTVSQKEAIKYIISAAYHEQPILIYPIFENRIKSMASLLNKGYVRIEDGQYFFNF